MKTSQESSIEFASFLADISNPGTGEILPGRLAPRLGLPLEDLFERWRSSGRETWPAFAGDLLALLDAIQDSTHCFKATVRRFLCEPLAPGVNRTADAYVRSGEAELALAILRQSRRRATGPDPASSSEL